MSTSGGVGGGSGRSSGLAAAHAMAACARVATSCGVRLYHIKSPEIDSVSFHGRGSQPAIAVAMNGSGLLWAACFHVHCPAGSIPFTGVAQTSPVLVSHTNWTAPIGTHKTFR